jgi:hypothetical protein
MAQRAYALNCYVCRASQEPAVDEEAAETIGQRLGFDGLPKLLSRMLKGLQKQS